MSRAKRRTEHPQEGPRDEQRLGPMSELSFEELSQQVGCVGVQAAQRIRIAARKGGDRHLDDNGDDDDDADLLPTINRIRKAFKTPSEVEDVLACSCPLCSPFRQKAESDIQAERSLAEKIWSSDAGLSSFSILILAGCSFAVQEFQNYEVEGLDRFCTRLKKESDPGPNRRKRLFRDIMTRFANGGEHQATRELDAANAFCEAVETKSRLCTIPQMTKLGASRTFPEYEVDQNLPFIESTQVQISNEKLHVRFWKCRIESTHAEDTLPEVLFRKRFDFHEDERDQIKAALAEAKTAIDFRNLDHPSIAEIVLAFKEISSPRIYVNLVFKYCELNLEGVLAADGICEDLDTNTGTSAPLPDHRLWKSLLGVVEAVSKVHSTAASSNNDELRGIKGHFDIKPENILVSEGKLLLTDFGQAAIYRPGAATWAPPERGKHIDPELSTHYDTWSLACVLLETLVFIVAASQGRSGSDAVRAFRTRRMNEVFEPRIASFWKLKSEGHRASKILRSSVLSEIRGLESHGNPHIQRVLEQIKAMLSIVARDRPDTTSCLHAFHAGVGREMFELPDQELRGGPWSISFQTRKMQEPLPCQVWIYELARRHKIIALLEYNRQSSVYSRQDDEYFRAVGIVPTTFFNAREGLQVGMQPSQYRPNAVYQCSFADLLEGVTLHFHQADHFFEFMVTMMDQELVTIGSMMKGARFRFKTCSLTQERAIKNTKTHIQEGIIQLWRRRPPRKGHSRSDAVAFQQSSKLKMAIFGREQDHSQNICLIVDVGSDTFELSSNQVSRQILFFQKNKKQFQGAVYRPTTSSSEDEVLQIYPSIPISPERINEDIDPRHKDTAVRIAELRLTMAGSDFDDFDDFLSLWYSKPPT